MRIFCEVVSLVTVITPVTPPLKYKNNSIPERPSPEYSNAFIARRCISPIFMVFTSVPLFVKGKLKMLFAKHIMKNKKSAKMA